MANYFNTLSLREKLDQLGVCEFMDRSEFSDGVAALKGKKIVIVGCGAQGLNQGLNLRDSGLDVSYTLRKEAIDSKRQSFLNASENGFKVGTYEELIPTADLVINLTPDKQHTAVVSAVMPLMKKGSTLSYSHGFNIVEEGMQIRKDITVIMVAPKSPGSEVREEYKRGFGVPTLIAVHPENDPEGKGWDYAKAYCVGTGGDRAGVLKSSFVAEVKSDLMGEQTILCGLLQTGSILCFDKMVEKGIDKGYASKLIQYGWEVITESLKHGGISGMMDRLSNPAKIKAFQVSEELKDIMRPLFRKHQDDIISGEFSRIMMEDWANGDKNLLTWRAATGETAFEKTPAGDVKIAEQEYYDNGLLMVAMVRAGVELAFETMTESGIIDESAYYESLHETPLIANTIARKKLFEMNRVISDTAEYGCYLFDHACKPLLANFMKTVDTDIIGKNFNAGKDNGVDNQMLIAVNEVLRSHPIEIVGAELREAMTEMKAIVS
ncbi:ketol-acid reductoisomerase [Cytophaga hutchinsonii]|uniref:Ketol-acid reductoisomerase (NADP(+)) n=1 Tax=Cytophaga hutchinsonii (strain ATCC 33406 / DSM 1761 / CIP 103989 / NBRC 15051 / NCIMB 9469 / D465) TaxID=269798 RepID=ILVC_CYTH3|nr:ketol-acid reductoisomerase [Cytophaga hutchinsonii]Q11VZ3.1 RecName: Full=Ketol-acid reductoisomerase (NADP(+)); Short=KARI; AltName: Full=Acetohydroxy-acid isomeroreductase; Short=AHIR; AltName: Full=Alpha-keto-beta-hydroxylacyl reductoisomerase; AltName: Full=Ketol-acid reductoisomerase type 2; AltName: Full=Ketol-acid reductoisomerase type II [Cytophaga hutchinsonii ATCC 33406]ABG58424.1 ketol-acid reductoisomerase [Cytophaga hutchinsonii ATCC 33406]SFX50465.1 ketol-acid reductoisomerase 